MEDSLFNEIKDLAQRISRKNGACKKGYSDLLKTENIGQFCRLLDKYWADVLGMHKESTLEAMSQLYPLYKSDFNRFGFAYNESAAQGKVIVNNATICATNSASVWAFGSSVVNAFGASSVYAHDNTVVYGRNNSSITLFGESLCQCYDRCVVNAYDKTKVVASGAVSITANSDAVVTAHSWNKILAVGDALVYAPTRTKITTLQRAKLIIKKGEKA